jgi:arylsulfate sulfotransferase
MHLTRPLGISLAVTAALIGAACSSSDPTSAPSSSAPGTSAAGPKVTIGALDLVANPDSVLSFELKFTTSAPAIVKLNVDGPGGAWSVTPEQAASTAHDVPVVGLRAGSTYHAWVTTNGGATTSRRVTIATKALPSDFPTFSTTQSDPSRMAPGVTMFTVTKTAPTSEPRPMLGNLIAVDAQGHVVWYHRAPVSIGDARMLPNGHILYEYNDMGAQEIDILGRVVREWTGSLERGPFRTDKYGRTIPGPKAIPVDIDSMHHEVSMLANGNILTISNELRTVSFTKPMCGEPASQFSGSYKLITDVIVEFEPETGRIVHKYPIADYLHPQTNPADANICGFGSQSVYPNFLYASRGEVRDWTHANAVILDAKNNRLLVSIRHLDTVLAIKYETDAQGAAGSELWRLGAKGGDFTLTGQGAWEYHQHAVELEADGSLLMFDNGNDRPNTKPFYSRAVRYQINDSGPKSSWTVSQQWEFRPTIGDSPVYAFFVGDANLLANGNVLVDTGGIVPPVKGVYAQIDEVVPAAASGGTVVFELRLTGPAPFVYRATRVPSLYGETAT